MTESQDKIIVGWREWFAFPELGIPAIKAKIDTGARTSALHTFKFETFTRQGELMVRFWVHPWQRRKNIERICEATVIDQRVVSDSGGHREERYVIHTPLRLGSHEWPVEVTLTNRDTMMFRMLLGRTAMEKHILVDAGASYRFGRPQVNPYTGKKIKYKPKQELEEQQA